MSRGQWWRHSTGPSGPLSCIWYCRSCHIMSTSAGVLWTGWSCAGVVPVLLVMWRPTGVDLEPDSVHFLYCWLSRSGRTAWLPATSVCRRHPGPRYTARADYLLSQTSRCVSLHYFVDATLPRGCWPTVCSWTPVRPTCSGVLQPVEVSTQYEILEFTSTPISACDATVISYFETLA